MHFPGFSTDAAKLMIERKVNGLGCDTLSIDYGASQDFAVHHLSLGAGLYHLENLADMNELPETGAFLIVAPIKLEGGSGGAVREFSLLPRVSLLMPELPEVETVARGLRLTILGSTV